MKIISATLLFLCSLLPTEVLKADDPSLELTRVSQRSVELLVLKDIELRLLELGYELTLNEEDSVQAGGFASFFTGAGLGVATFLTRGMGLKVFPTALAVTAVSSGISYLLYRNEEAATGGFGGSFVVFAFLYTFGGMELY